MPRKKQSQSETPRTTLGDSHVLGAAPGLVKSLGLQISPVPKEEVTWEKIKSGIRICVGPYILVVSLKPYGARAWRVLLPTVPESHQPSRAVPEMPGRPVARRSLRPEPQWAPAPPIEPETRTMGSEEGPPVTAPGPPLRQAARRPRGLAWGGHDPGKGPMQEE
jgi:hypothetical protein